MIITCFDLNLTIDCLINCLMIRQEMIRSENTRLTVADNSEVHRLTVSIFLYYISIFFNFYPSFKLNILSHDEKFPRNSIASIPLNLKLDWCSYSNEPQLRLNKYLIADNSNCFVD